MLTTSHGIIGYLLFQKKGKQVWIYSVLGAIFPDIPMIVSLIVFYVYRFFLGSYIPHTVLHDQLINRIISPMGHSVFLWIGIILISYCIRKRSLHSKIFAFGVGGMSHIAIDFLTHQGDWTWNHLYPLDFPPVDGIVYYMDIRFFLLIHTIWILIFGPKIYRYIKNKYKK